MNHRLTMGIAVVVCVFAARAGIPIQNMSSKSLGLEYQGAMRGQLITAAEVMSHERIQAANLHYAPIPYLLFSVGAGANRLTTRPYNEMRFDGRYGFSPKAAVALYTPRFANEILGLTGAVKFLYLKSKDKDKRTYSAYVVNPQLGIKISAGKYFDIEGGARWHYIWGEMENDRTGFEADYSNVETLRGYASLTVHSPAHGVYASVDFDGSQEIGKDWSKGPAEAMLGVRVGVILRPDYVNRKIEERNMRYFPAYKDMKKKQEEMAEEIE